MAAQLVDSRVVLSPTELVSFENVHLLRGARSFTFNFCRHSSKKYYKFGSSPAPAVRYVCSKELFRGCELIIEAHLLLYEPLHSVHRLCLSSVSTR
jgi:hypothetical protein